MIVYFVDGPLNGQTREFKEHSYVIYYATHLPLVSAIYMDTETTSLFKRGIYGYTNRKLPDGRWIFTHRGVEE